MPFFAHNPLTLFKKPAVENITPAPQAATNPIGLNPMFGRPNWTFVNIQKAPVTGPDPRLAIGSGKTGNNALPGNDAQLPGYMSDTQYFPTMNDYSPWHQESNKIAIPKTIDHGENGRELVGTYEPHDFIPAQRFFMQNRSAHAWQQQSFPPDNRNLLTWQQAQKYNLRTIVEQARPLASNNYFLGYQADPAVVGSIGGQSGNGGY